MQQRGFTDAVLTNDGNALADFHHQVDIAEQVILVALAQFFHHQGVTEQFFLLLKTDKRVLAAGWLDLGQLNLVNLFGPRRGLARFRGIGREAADKRLQLGNLSLLAGVIGLQALTGGGGGGHVLVVVAGHHLQLAVVQVGHVGADAVQEVAVVGDDDHGAVALLQHTLKPADGIDIQVVGRLVQQHDIRVGKQHLSQQYPKLPAGRYGAHRAVVLFNGDIQTKQQFTGAGFGRIAIHLAELHFQVGHAHALFFGHLGHGVDGVTLGLDFP